MLILLKVNSYLTVIDPVSDPGYLFNLNSNAEIAATMTVPILQMRKQRDAAQPVYRANKWKSQNLNLGSLVLEPVS